MKKYISIFLSVCAAVLYGCTDMEDALTEGILSVESETLWFDAAGGSQLIEMRTYAGSWTISQDEDSKDWCGLSKTEGTTSSSFEVTVQPNDNLERTTTLVLDAPGCEPVNIRIIQNGEKDNQFTATQEIDGEMVEFNPDPVDGQVPYLIDPDKPLTITFKPSVSNTMFGCRNDVYAHIGIVDGDFWKYTVSDLSEPSFSSNFDAPSFKLYEPSPLSATVPFTSFPLIVNVKLPFSSNVILIPSAPNFA